MVKLIIYPATMGSGGGGCGLNVVGNSRFGGGSTGTGDGLSITNGYGGGYATATSSATTTTLHNGGAGGGGAGGGGKALVTTNTNGGTGGIGITNSTINTICSAIATNMNSLVANWSTSVFSSPNYYLGGGGGVVEVGVVFLLQLVITHLVD